MSDSFWGDVSLGNDTYDNFWGDVSLGNDTYTYDIPSTDYNFDYSTIFSNPDWMNSTFGDSTFDFTNDIDWSQVLSNPDYFGAEYDPLTDPDASVDDILSYVDKFNTDPDLYSLVSGDDTKLGIGENLLSITGDNTLGRALTDALNSDGLSTSSSGSASGAVKPLLDASNKLLGGASSAARSPLGQLAQKLMAIAAHRKDISNQNKGYDRAQQTAMANSQVGLRGNRTGLPNFNGAAQDPYSYVQPAPTIERNR